MTTMHVDQVDPSDTRLTQGPLLRIALDGGCGLPGCSCCPDPYLCVSDGATLFSVRLTAAEVQEFRATGRLETSPTLDAR